jgi:protein-S-isoprenylcysteine O-methyltransferase Ste14
MRILRHALAISLFPATVAGLVPWWLARSYGVSAGAPRSAPGWLAVVTGAAVFIVGLALFSASLRRFDADGDGTLAPWDPPRHLVITGPYAYVRNPMISGVLLVLIGEGLALRSIPHLAWAALFAAINAVYMPLLEEPGLRSRFGADYDAYARHVPRLIPRARPWRGGRGGDGRRSPG